MSRFTSNIKYYAIGSMATKALSFMIIPLYSSAVYPESLGTYQYITSFISLLLPVLYQSIWEGMFRFSILSNGDERIVIGNTLKYLLGLSVIYVALFVIASGVFDLEFALLILLQGLSSALMEYYQYAARALKENKYYSISAIVHSIITLGFTVFFIIILRLQILGLFIVAILSNVACVGILEYRIRLFSEIFVSKYDFTGIKQIVKYSFPLAINSISWWLINSCSNIIVVNMLDSKANGLMAMAQRFGNILVIITTIFSMAWQEESFRTADDNNCVYFNKLLDFLIRGLFSFDIIAIPATFLFFNYFIDSSYLGSAILTCLLFVVGTINAINTHLGSVFLTRGESNILFWTTLISGIVSVVLSIVSLSIWGAIEFVCIASIISCIINLAIRLCLLYKRFEIKFPYVTFCIFFLLACLFIYLVDCIGMQNTQQLIILLLVSTIVLFFVNKQLLIRIVWRKKY